MLNPMVDHLSQSEGLDVQNLLWQGGAATSFTVRQTTLADAEPLVIMHLAAHREAYSRLLPEAAFATREARVPERVERQRRIVRDADSHWIALDNVGVLGFAHSGPPREKAEDEWPPPKDCELYGLYVRGRGYGLGVAQNLVSAAIGDRPAYLWVLEDNPRAQSFYRKVGFVQNQARRQLPPEWHGLWEVQMVRT